MSSFENPIFWIIGILLIAASLGVVFAKKPVHSSLSFLLTLLLLAALYLQLYADFIAVMQVLVYAGAILVIFMFVIVLFQDAYLKISKDKSKSSPMLLFISGSAMILSLIFLCIGIIHLGSSTTSLQKGFGSVEALGTALYVDFFFPFEAVVLLFLIAVVGALYIGRKVH